MASLFPEMTLPGFREWCWVVVCAGLVSEALARLGGGVARWLEAESPTGRPTGSLGYLVGLSVLGSFLLGLALVGLFFPPVIVIVLFAFTVAAGTSWRALLVRDLLGFRERAPAWLGLCLLVAMVPSLI